MIVCLSCRLTKYIVNYLLDAYEYIEFANKNKLSIKDNNAPNDRQTANTL